MTNLSNKNQYRYDYALRCFLKSHDKTTFIFILGFDPIYYIFDTI